MRLLFVADGRSPIALNWVRYFVERGDEVHLASTYPCAGLPGLRGLTVIPLAGSAFTAGGPAGGQGWLRRLAPVGVRTALRRWLGPLTLKRSARRLRALVETVQPELVHALRIPFEGMLAAEALAKDPELLLVVSVWGNDFTLHAPASEALGRLTRQTLRRADALHPDCRRDARLAREWGFEAHKPVLVAPGNGGIDLQVFYPPQDEAERLPLVVNPRGIRAYVRNEAFFQAAGLIHTQRPEVRFACPTMAGEAQAEQWRRASGTEQVAALLPRLASAEMAALFRQAQVAVSPSTHDGTPNTLLEAMACGCFPVAGDLEPLREWIEPGENGLLVDPGDPQALARAVLQALDEPQLRGRAAEINTRLVSERAEYRRVMAKAEEFYRGLAGVNRPQGPPEFV